MALPIPFRDASSESIPGLAAFLKFQAEGASGLRGALFAVNALAEPIEFAFARTDIRGSTLWRPGDARRSAMSALCRTLFPALSSKPDCLFMLAEEVGPRLFLDEIHLDIPAARIGDENSVHSPAESVERSLGTYHVFWIGPAPEPGTRPRALLETLLSRELLTEPFDRALTGLNEAYAGADVVG
jgi:hypothetical protein